MRLRTRTIMVLVAIAAIAMAVPGEVRNRQKRRDIARVACFYQTIAARHDKEWAACQAAIGHRRYDEYEREWILIQSNTAKSKFGSWAEEAAWHANEASECRNRAVYYLNEEKKIRRRLLLPVLRDIKERTPS